MSAINHLLRAEIDLDAIAHNIRALKGLIHPQARLLAAVKANAYGHGALEVSRTALAGGADYLGVARPAEGIALRDAGITAPILIFGYSPPELAPELAAHGLEQSVYDLDTAGRMAACLSSGDASLAVHLKVDTGMGRLGIPCPDEAMVERCVDMVAQLTLLPELKLTGLFSHFATADSRDKGFAQRQFQRFETCLDALTTRGLRPPLCHMANSGAIIDLPATHLDMVRAGISVYGLYPSDEVMRARIDLRPALSLKARIIHVKTVPPGTPISYGCTWRAERETSIATVPIGYADGYSRGLSNRGMMLVGARRVPIVGRVCMDLTMLDVTEVPGVRIGDEVVLIGRQGKAAISADEVAAWNDTINYEVVAALTARVPRVYLNGDA
ncbi:MAG: alanine racemase [Desulfosarcinaceae bacterium]|jgi:alanine racemase